MTNKIEMKDLALLAALVILYLANSALIYMWG